MAWWSVDGAVVGGMAGMGGKMIDNERVLSRLRRKPRLWGQNWRNSCRIVLRKKIMRKNSNLFRIFYYSSYARSA